MEEEIGLGVRFANGGWMMLVPKPLPTVYVGDDCPDTRRMMFLWLRAAGCEAKCFGDGQELCEAVARREPDLICLDLMMPRMSGMEVLRWLKDRRFTCPVVVFSAVDDVKTVVQAVQLGAHDYETKPLHQHRINALVRTALENRTTVVPPVDDTGIVGSAKAMQPVFEAIRKCARSQISVLITGESGTGKELVARAIHRHSRRAERPFIAINCGAIPENLQESELFGHERGAFTGAVATHAGYFEQADSGTVLLDEVGELSPSAQQRLLRVLQDRQVQRLGGTRMLSLDLRVLAATNRPLHREVKRGAFRCDLYYRLAVFPIEIPPLRERREDILPLIAHFSAKHGGPVNLSITDDVRRVLESHSWPGNVRELENVVQYALVNGGDTLGIDSIPPLLDLAEPWDGEFTHVRSKPGTDHDLHRVERATISHAMCAANGNVAEAARLLGMSRATLYRKLARYRNKDGSAESA